MYSSDPESSVSHAMKYFVVSRKKQAVCSNHYIICYFAGESQPEVLQAKLENGYRHEKPGNCPDHLYNNVLVNCWQPRSERPSFDLLMVAVKDAKGEMFNSIRRT